MAKKQKKFQFLEEGTKIPVYTIFAISEKMAIKKLYRYLENIGKQNAEMVNIEG